MYIYTCVNIYIYIYIHTYIYIYTHIYIKNKDTSWIHVSDFRAAEGMVIDRIFVSRTHKRIRPVFVALGINRTLIGGWAGIVIFIELQIKSD